MESIKATAQRIIRSGLSCFTFRSTPDPQFDFPPAKISSSPPSLPKKTVQTTTQETTLIISHGAFQSQPHYQTYLDAVLQDTSITNVLIPHQTAAGPDPPADCFARDVATIRSAIVEELSAGRDVLLLAHSYGGIPCCEALVDLPSITTSVTPGRILGIIFVSAFVVEAGQSLVSSHPFGRAAWVGIEVSSFGASLTVIPVLTSP
jgi:pimeloyl-ACP methyl ester carboxylesterase